MVGGGSTFDVIIDNPGVHRYYCIPHGGPNGAGMSGMIIANCPPSSKSIPLDISFNTSIANPAGYDILMDGVPIPGSPFDYDGTGPNGQTINVAGDGSSHVFTIRDVNDPTCDTETDFTSPDCGSAPACSVSLSATQNGPCNAAQKVPYQLTVNAINGSNQGFKVLVDGVQYAGSPFPYGSGGPATVTVEVNGNGAAHTIVVQDMADNACQATTSVTTPNCSIPCGFHQFNRQQW